MARRANPTTTCWRASLRLEYHHLVTGTRWFGAKTDIIRHAVRAYVAHPLWTQLVDIGSWLVG